MVPFMNILGFLVMAVIAAAVVFLSARAVRCVLERVLMCLSIHIPETVRPLFDPSAYDPHMYTEYTFWQSMSHFILGVLTLVLAFYLFDIVTQLWSLLCTL
jgi:hypothetical protein